MGGWIPRKNLNVFCLLPSHQKREELYRMACPNSLLFPAQSSVTKLLHQGQFSCKCGASWVTFYRIPNLKITLPTTEPHRVAYTILLWFHFALFLFIQTTEQIDKPGTWEGHLPAKRENSFISCGHLLFLKIASQEAPTHGWFLWYRMKLIVFRGKAWEITSQKPWRIKVRCRKIYFV